MLLNFLARSVKRILKVCKSCIHCKLPARKLRFNFVVGCLNIIVKGLFKGFKLGTHAAGCSCLKLIQGFVNFVQAGFNCFGILLNLCRKVFVAFLLFLGKFIKVSKHAVLNFLHCRTKTLFQGVYIGTAVFNLSKLVLNILFVRTKLLVNSFKNIKMLLLALCNRTLNRIRNVLVHVVKLNFCVGLKVFNFFYDILNLCFKLRLEFVCTCICSSTFLLQICNSSFCFVN